MFCLIRPPGVETFRVGTLFGFPHDRPENMRETLTFVRDIARAGVADLGNGYYMALPGTEFFESLVGRGRIRLDREYFRHILEGLAIVPAASYCDAYGRLGLFLWKVRPSIAFYWTRVRERGARAAVASAKETFGGESHGTKLQTAVRVALKNAIAIVRTGFKERWMPLEDEHRLFAGWDDIHRAIWSERLGGDLASNDPTDLHERNVIPVIRSRHAARRAFRPQPVAPVEVGGA